MSSPSKRMLDEILTLYVNVPNNFYKSFKNAEGEVIRLESASTNCTDEAIKFYVDNLTHSDSAINVFALMKLRDISAYRKIYINKKP